MTKKEMILKIIEGLNYPNNEMTIKNRCKNSKVRVEEVYNHYLKTNKTKEDKIFCSNLLIVW